MDKVRTLAIADYIQEKKYCTCTDLAAIFDVSPATIQRDITTLVRQKKVRKVHGGVACLEMSARAETSPSKFHFAQRIELNTDKKRHIARLAVTEIHDGDIVFLDSSTTSLFLARQLQESKLAHLTLLTNSVLIIQEFHLLPPHFTLLALGGNFDYQLNAFLGRSTINQVEQLIIHKAFISAVGLTHDGLFTYHENHADFLRHIIRMAGATIALLDSTKLGKTGLFNICPPSNIAKLFCDQQPSDNIQEAFPQIKY